MLLELALIADRLALWQLTHQGSPLAGLSALPKGPQSKKNNVAEAMISTVV